MSGNTAESPRAGFPGREDRTAVSVAPEVDDVLSVAFELLRDGLDAWAERARDEFRGVLVPEL